MGQAHKQPKRAGGGELPFAKPEKSPPATKQQFGAFFSDLDRELEKVEFFRPEEKRGVMSFDAKLEPDEERVLDLGYQISWPAAKSIIYGP